MKQEPCPPSDMQIILLDSGQTTNQQQFYKYHHFNRLKSLTKTDTLSLEWALFLLIQTIKQSATKIHLIKSGKEDI